MEKISHCTSHHICPFLQNTRWTIGNRRTWWPCTLYVCFSLPIRFTSESTERCPNKQLILCWRRRRLSYHHHVMWNCTVASSPLSFSVRFTFHTSFCSIFFLFFFFFSFFKYSVMRPLSFFNRLHVLLYIYIYVFAVRMQQYLSRIFSPSI